MTPPKKSLMREHAKSLCLTTENYNPREIFHMSPLDVRIFPVIIQEATLETTFITSLKMGGTS